MRLTRRAGEQWTGARCRLASAINDCRVAEPEPRLRTINVATHGEPARRSTGWPSTRGSSALLLIRTAEPRGGAYWPIYEAAAEHELPVGIHFGGWSRGPNTGVGYGSYYIEDTVGMATAFSDQLTSLVCEGVFERFPGLKVVLIEGGVAWLAPLMWRLDRAWSLLRAEAPCLTHLPSELIREHVWVTTVGRALAADYSAEMPEQLATDPHILFATDYPHWVFDAPDRALPPSVPPALREAILRGNAHALYRLVGPTN
jgi:predicted TIM-barrel fold metal-dependent hydrolase